MLGQYPGKTIRAGTHRGHQLQAGTAVGSPLRYAAGYSEPAGLATLEDAERQATEEKLSAAHPGAADRLRMSLSVLVHAPQLWGHIGPCAQALLAGAGGLTPGPWT